MIMTKHPQIHLDNLTLPCRIGTYGPNDIVPDAHVLDMTLYIDKSLVVVDRDHMECVFDYDPLIKIILEIAVAQHYETQEYLVSRIFDSYFSYNEIHGVMLFLRKSPVQADGSLGIQVQMEREEFFTLKNASH